MPEEPFIHGSLVRGGRLKSFPSLGSEAVTSEYRQPCVVFTGHPSLRCGDVVHFMELWANNVNNLGRKIFFLEMIFIIGVPSQLCSRSRVSTTSRRWPRTSPWP